MTITESRAREILNSLDDQGANITLPYQDMMVLREAAALIRQQQAAIQAAWQAGLDEGRIQARAQHPLDIEAMLRECVPGGSIVDPQVVADSIRSYFDGKEVMQLERTGQPGCTGDAVTEGAHPCNAQEGVIGKVVGWGDVVADVPGNQSGMVIATTREALRNAPPMLFSKVRVVLESCDV